MVYKLLWGVLVGLGFNTVVVRCIVVEPVAGACCTLILLGLHWKSCCVVALLGHLFVPGYFGFLWSHWNLVRHLLMTEFGMPCCLLRGNSQSCSLHLGRFFHCHCPEKVVILHA